MTELTTTNIVLDSLFSIGLLICVWYFLLRDDTLKKFDVDDFSISLDDYEKELQEVTKYPKTSIATMEDWKEVDRKHLTDEEFETMYQETKSGEKIISFDVETRGKEFNSPIEYRDSNGEITTLNNLVEKTSKKF